MSRRGNDDDPLLAAAGRRLAAQRAPLAERLRPRRLEELFGQPGLLAAGSLLRGEIAARRLSSLVLWGPPGSGKTTLARLLAEAAGYELVPVSALSAGVAELRAAIEAAAARLGAGGSPTLLFVDEIHRFHKGQQDALLHAVEDGRVVLVGATTETPSFHVNAALLSRCRVVRLQPLDPEAMRALLERARDDVENGLPPGTPPLAPEAVEELVQVAGGDARRLLGGLERAALLARARGASAINVGDVRDARGERVLAHDRDGERHYDLLSALHKSLRGSDPDAAVYWIARLLEAGEDPLVVARRMVRMASEDVGLADPGSLRVALDAMEAVRFLGMPEGDAALAQAAVRLALAPKSDAVYRAISAAREAVRRHGALPVPTAIRNAPTRLHAAAGHGRGYVNPHAAPGGLTPLVHLPPELADARFYEPLGRGSEELLARRLAEVRRRRDPGSAAPPAGPEAAPGGTRD